MFFDIPRTKALVCNQSDIYIKNQDLGPDPCSSLGPSLGPGPDSSAGAGICIWKYIYIYIYSIYKFA